VFDLRQGQRIFLLAAASRPALGPTQSPIQWVPAVISPGVKRGRGVTLTTHPHLVPRSTMSRSYTSSPPNASMACSGTAYLTCLLALPLLSCSLLASLHKGLMKLICVASKRFLSCIPRTHDKSKDVWGIGGNSSTHS
jgi:hypothetical protein